MPETPPALQSPNPDVHIRPVRLSDVETLRRDCFAGRSLLSVQRLVARAQRIARQQYGLGVVAEDGDGVAGYGQLTAWPRCSEISDLVVCEGKRGQGIGTALIQYLARAARDMNAECVEIGAAVSNGDALRLYRRLGFQEHRIVELHYASGDVTVQYLRLRLK